MGANNTEEYIYQYGKATYDTATWIKTSVHPNDVTFTSDRLKITGAGINLVIPLAQAYQGKKEWDEAIANGTGNIAQDVLVDLALTSTWVYFAGTPSGWATVALGFIALGITWWSADTNVSLGKYLEDELVEMKKPLTLDQLLQDQHTTIPLNENTNVTMTDASGKTFNFSYANQIAQIESNMNEKVWTDFLNDLVKETTVQKIALPDRTLTVENLTNLELRNAIDGIDKVSFLLSNITIKVGEKIDIGNGGVYTVKSGDTLSVIAQNNGTVTKDLVKLNPWLFDDNRIEFNYPTKVLVAEGTVISDNNNHDLIGQDVADILIDHNGGNDTLIANGGDDYLDGGTGSDTLSGGAGYDVLLGGNDSDLIYGGAGDDTLIGGDDNASDNLFGGTGADVLLGGGGDDTLAGGDAANLYADKELDYLEGGVGNDLYCVSHQDIISDADNSGFILFNDKQLNGIKTKVDDNTYEDVNFTYSLDGNNLIVVDKNLGEYITIENFQDGAMGINLDKEEENANEPILIKISNPTTLEGNEGERNLLAFTIETSRPLKANESVTLKLSTEEFTATSDDYGALSANTTTALQKSTIIKTNTKNYKTSSTCQEYFDSIKKHFCTITCQDGLWHVAQNNQDFKLQNRIVS